MSEQPDVPPSREAVRERAEFEEQLRKKLASMSIDDIVAMRKSELESTEDSTDPEPKTPIGHEPSGSGQKLESDVISAKSFEKGMKAGHMPETLTQEEAPGITENDKASINLRHGRTPEQVMTNVIMLASYGNTVEEGNKILRQQGVIDDTQFARNEYTEKFCKTLTASVVNTMESVKGHRVEVLMNNIASGKMAHEAIQQQAEQKRTGRLSRIRKFFAGETDE